VPTRAIRAIAAVVPLPQSIALDTAGQNFKSGPPGALSGVGFVA
jgi:hypothetical protein